MLVKGMTPRKAAETACSDYKALIARAGSTADKVALAQKLANRRLASGVVPELDACFAALELEDAAVAP